MRILGSVTAMAIAACRTAPRETCFPERGAEVWVETRYPASVPPAGAPAALSSLRVTPATASPLVPGGVIAGRQPRFWLIGPAGAPRPDTISGGGITPGGIVGLPGAARAIRPGVYQVRVRDVGWADAVRDVSFHAGERLDLEVESRQAATCLGSVIQTSGAGHRDVPPNVSWSRRSDRHQVVRVSDSA